MGPRNPAPSVAAGLGKGLGWRVKGSQVHPTAGPFRDKLLKRPARLSIRCKK